MKSIFTVQSTRPANALKQIKESDPTESCAPDDPVNICYMIDNLGTGGTENYVLQQIQNLDRDKFRCHLCLLDGTSEASKGLEPGDVPVIRLGIKKITSIECLKAMSRFKNYLRAEDIRLIQTHFFDSTFVGILAARWAGNCRIVKTRRDLVFFADRFQRWLGRPINIVFNRMFVNGYIANSQDCKQALIDREAIGKAAVIEVIPNGVDLDRFQPDISRIKTTPSDQWKIGIVSMLRPEKNVPLFVEMAALVLKKHPDIEFLIAGDGPDREGITNQIRHLGIEDRVFLRGRINNVPGFLKEIQIGVLTSLTEGMPNSIVEYMAAGNAVVATAVGGTCDIVRNRINGLLATSNDAQELANAICALIDDPALCYQLAKTARLDVERDFDSETTIQRHQEMYEKLINAN